MSYTTPGQPQGKPFSVSNFLREALIAELVAINGYVKVINEVNIPELRKLLYHIMLDEKRHYGMFLEALRKCDCVEFEKSLEAISHVEIKNKPLKTRNYEGKDNTAIILKEIRNNIKGELEAVILYESIIEEIDDKEIQNLLQRIANEEKEHTEELTQALIRLDKDPFGPLDCFIR